MDKRDLLRNSKEYLEDAKILLNNGRYHGAKYLAGYVMELRLKWFICKIYHFQRLKYHQLYDVQNHLFLLQYFYKLNELMHLTQHEGEKQ